MGMRVICIEVVRAFEPYYFILPCSWFAHGYGRLQALFS